MQQQDYTRLLFTQDRPYDFRQQSICNLVYSYLNPEIRHLCDSFDQLFNDQAALIGINAEITYQGRKFTHYRCIHDQVRPLEPSLADEMDNLLNIDRNLREMLTLMLNYTTNVFVNGHTKADHLALLPSSLHQAYHETISDYGPRFNALCWSPDPTLSPTRVATFLNQNKTVIERMHVLELDLLTR